MKSFADIRKGTSVIQENSLSRAASLEAGKSMLAEALNKMQGISTLASDLYQHMVIAQVNPNDINLIQEAYNILKVLHDKSKLDQEAKQEGIHNYP